MLKVYFQATTHKPRITQKENMRLLKSDFYSEFNIPYELTYYTFTIIGFEDNFIIKGASNVVERL
jgi:hypothetical protein